MYAYITHVKEKFANFKHANLNSNLCTGFSQMQKVERTFGATFHMAKGFLKSANHLVDF